MKTWSINNVKMLNSIDKGTSPNSNNKIKSLIYLNLSVTTVSIQSELNLKYEIDYLSHSQDLARKE